MTSQHDRSTPAETAPPVELSAYRPSGRKPDPMVLVEGTAHSGMQWLAAELSTSERIGRAWWLDLDSDAETYTNGTNFEIVPTGSWDVMMARLDLLAEAAAMAWDDHGQPPMVVVNSMSTAWRWCQLYAARMAAEQLEVRQRRAGDPRRRIEPDPYTAVTIPGNLWDEAHKRHRLFVQRLRTMPAVIVMTARAEVHLTDQEGRALPGGQDYRINVHRDITAASHIWVRTTLGGDAQVISVADRDFHRQYGGCLPDPDPKLTLEKVIFETYGFAVPDVRTEAEAPQTE